LTNFKISGGIESSSLSLASSKHITTDWAANSTLQKIKTSLNMFDAKSANSTLQKMKKNLLNMFDAKPGLFIY
jgi:hypothetical protein